MILKPQVRLFLLAVILPVFSMMPITMLGTMLDEAVRGRIAWSNAGFTAYGAVACFFLLRGRLK